MARGEMVGSGGEGDGEEDGGKWRRRGEMEEGDTWEGYGGKWRRREMKRCGSQLQDF